jgi:hypothetical protein
MARTVLATIAGRMASEGRLQAVEGAPVERPALASLAVAGRT